MGSGPQTAHSTPTTLLLSIAVNTMSSSAVVHVPAYKRTFHCSTVLRNTWRSHRVPLPSVGSHRGPSSGNSLHRRGVAHICRCFVLLCRCGFGHCSVGRAPVVGRQKRNLGDIPITGLVSALPDGLTTDAAPFQAFGTTMAYTCKEMFLESQVYSDGR